jgi:hypothetical protein
MDFLDPKKKRAHRIRLFIGYGLMAIALGIGTTILVYQARGFGVDRKTGEIIQNGLAFVEAHPVGADVYVNGELKGRTNIRLNLPSSTYKLELRQPGYRNWTRQLDLQGGSVEQMVYPFLFPEKLVTKDIQSLSALPGFATTSLDRHWLLYQQATSLTDFRLVDLSTDDNITTPVALPPALLTPADGVHQLELVEWSSDNRHVLVRHTFTGGIEFAIIDRQTPEQSININKLFSHAFSQVVLRDKKPDVLYVYDQAGGVLQSANTKNQVLTPVLKDVLAFKSHGDEVVEYVTPSGAPAGKVLARVLSDKNTYTIRELPLDTQYMLDVARFEGHWYMAVGARADKKTYIYRDIFDQVKSPGKVVAPASTLRTDGLQDYVSFSGNVRFVAVQAGAEFAVYDAETKRSYRYDTKLPLEAKAHAMWMDGHRLTLVSGGKTIVMDYDGINRQTLTPASPAFQAFFDRDYNAMFTLGPSAADATKSAVVRTELRVK